MSKLDDKLLKNSKIKLTAPLMESKIYGKKEMVPTVVPMVNVALSGQVDGGLTPGLTVIAGPSKHFKTMFTILLAASYLKKYPDARVLFYDNEFGSPIGYFKAFGIEEDRIIHSPFKNIEELTFDISAQLDGLERGDKVFIMIDSIGNAASKKEVDDALSGNSAQDMSRAKKIKGLWRIVTPYLNTLDIPCVAVNHTYKTQEMYSKDVVSGGTGIYYSADNIWIIGRQQEKDGKEVTGYNFIINVEKSRYVKEKSKIPISVSWEEGISRWSGMFDVALQGGYIVAPKQGWYCVANPETGEVEDKNQRRADLETNGPFWKKMLAETTFPQYIETTYRLPEGSLISEEIEED